MIVEAANVARAVEGGFGLAETLGLAGSLTAGAGMPPIALMTYLNPMLALRPSALGRGRRRSRDRRLHRAGHAPGQPHDRLLVARVRAAGARHRVPRRADIDRRRACGRSPKHRGASSISCPASGVTGERGELAAELAGLVERLRSWRGRDLPVAVGFGISTPQQAAQVARIADGVIVGSAVVRRQRDPDELSAFVARLAGAVRGA